MHLYNIQMTVLWVKGLSTTPPSFTAPFMPCCHWAWSFWWVAIGYFLYVACLNPPKLPGCSKFCLLKHLAILLFYFCQNFVWGLFESYTIGRQLSLACCGHIAPWGCQGMLLTQYSLKGERGRNKGCTDCTTHTCMCIYISDIDSVVPSLRGHP